MITAQESSTLDNLGQPGSPDHLRCEYLENPIGLDEPSPRFSWQVRDPRRGAVQSAYQVQVASSPQRLADDAPDQWDSGKIAGGQSIQVQYAGIKLESRRRYHWRIRTWDAHDQASPWSNTAFWEMGLLEPTLWKGQWIGPVQPADVQTMTPCPFLRRTFQVDEKIRRARIYATAKGLYELYLNGRRVGQDHLTPGWTEYHSRIAYQTYDVTCLINQGDNVLGAILGDGWYGGHIAGYLRLHMYGESPFLLGQLELELEDGTTRTIATDNQWRWNTGPILQSDLMRGEIYDARLEMPGWNNTGFDDKNWKTPAVHPLDHQIKLIAQASPPIRHMHTLKARSRTQIRPGVWIFDFGQNMVGNIRLNIAGPTGNAINIRYGEMIRDDGTLYTENYRTAQPWDRYILKGDDDRLYGPRHHTEAPREIYQPRFTFKGFRYAEVTGYPGIPPLWTLEGIVLYSANRTSGEFECSDPLLNQLQSNIVWSQRGNFLEIPTDCPQRDERMGWLGDAQVFARTACFNMDVAAFYAKWMKDVELGQRDDGAFPDVTPNALRFRPNGHLNFANPAWADAAISIPWDIYLCYGDKRILQRHYDAMIRWIDYCRRHSDNLIRPDGGFGDWLSGDSLTPSDLINTAWFARSTRLMGRIATILGRDDDANRYEQLFHEIRSAFNHCFVAPSGRIAGDTQTAYTLALCFDLLPDALRPAAAGRLAKLVELKDNHLSTGFLGTPWLLQALTQGDRPDLAYALLHQTTRPSWLFAVTHGATTIWERWDGWTPDTGFADPHMNSYNHYAFGAVGQWMYQNIGGINLDEQHPAYKHFLIQPRPFKSGLTCARTSYNSIHGTILTHWKLRADHWTLDLIIPPNTQATLRIPARSSAAITEQGRPLDRAAGLSQCRIEGDCITCTALSGQYAFRIELADENCHPTAVPL